MDAETLPKNMGVGRRLVIAISIALIFLGGLEFLTRIFVGEAAKVEIDPVRRAGHVNGGMKFDAQLGWDWPKLPAPLVGLDSHGFRHPEIEMQKPDKTFRAIALGDSQTYGAGVLAGETWPQLTEVALRKMAPEGWTIEVLNAGISGYSSLQILRKMRHRHRPFGADVFLIDGKTYDSPRDEPDIPLYDLPPFLAPLLFKSRLYYAMTLFNKKMNPPPSDGKPYRAPDPTQPPRIKAWYNHDLIVKEAAVQGAEVIFLDFPFWDNKRNVDQIRCLAPKSDLPRGATLAPVCQAIQGDGMAFKDLFFDNNHFKIPGNQIVADAVAEVVVQSPKWPGFKTP